jgi:hypothetical protein
VRAREAADKALGADDADLRAAQLEHVVGAVEHDDAGLLEHRSHLARAVRVPVVVAEHGQHRQLELAARVGHDRRLLRLPVRREVAGQQQEVGASLERAERGGGPLAVVRALAEVDVPGRSDPDPALAHETRGYPIPCPG